MAVWVNLHSEGLTPSSSERVPQGNNPASLLHERRRTGRSRRLLRNRFESADQVVANPLNEWQQPFHLGTSNPNALIDPAGSVATVSEIVFINPPSIVRCNVTPVHHQVDEVALLLIDVLESIYIKPTL